MMRMLALCVVLLTGCGTAKSGRNTPAQTTDAQATTDVGRQAADVAARTDGRASAGNSLPTTAGRHDVALSVNGVQRTAHLILPTGFSTSKTVPLVVLFHGASGSASGFADKLPALRALADQHGVVLVFPQGLKNTEGKSAWNWANPPLEEEFDAAPDDVAFALALLDAATAELAVDAAKVVIAGYSKGGRMAQTVAALHPERAMGLAVVSTSVGSTFAGGKTWSYCAKPTTPLDALLVHGSGDTTLPYQGGSASTPFSDTVAWWREVNACPKTPDTQSQGGVKTETFQNCTGARLTAVSVKDMGHVWPEMSDGFGVDMGKLLFAFFGLGS